MAAKWTSPYFGIEYLKTPRNIHISVVRFSNGMANAIYIDKDKNKHLNESNFSADKEYYGEYNDVKKMAEGWL